MRALAQLLPGAALLLSACAGAPLPCRGTPQMTASHGPLSSFTHSTFPSSMSLTPSVERLKTRGLVPGVGAPLCGPKRSMT